MGRARRRDASGGPVTRWAPRLLVVVIAGLAVLAVLAGHGARWATAQGDVGPSPPALDFGEVGAGGEALAALSLDSSFEDVTIMDLALVGADGSWFTVHLNESDALADEAPITQVSVVPEVARRIVVRVRVPADAVPGERIAELRLEQRSTDDTDETGVGVDVPLTVTVAGQAVSSGEVVDLEIPAVEVGSPIEVRARLRNTGTTMLAVEAEITAVIDDVAGAGQRYRAEIVAPGTDRVVGYTLEGAPPEGTHEIEAVFRSGDDVLATLVGEAVVGLAPATQTGTAGAPPLSGERERRVWPIFAFGLLAVIAALAIADRTARPEAAHAISRRLHRGVPRRGRHHAESGGSGWSRERDRTEP